MPRKALFEPVLMYAGYWSIEVEENENGCRVVFLPPKGWVGDPESGFLFLLGQEEGQEDFYIGDVRVRFYSLEFSREFIPLNFEETVAFLKSLKEYKLAV